MPVQETKTKTIAGDVYYRIRQDIIAGQFPPGTVLRSDWMRQRYSVGISPLREALTRLSSERLIVNESQRGFRVAPIDGREVKDVLKTRILIETEAMRRAIENGGVEWEGRILAAHHVLSRGAIPQQNDSNISDWVEHHRAFHMSLLSASESPWLMYMAGLLFDQSERYRGFLLMARAEQLIIGTEEDEQAISERDVGEEHRRILEAALARNADEACLALVDHYTLTAESVLCNIAQRTRQITSPLVA